MNNAIMTKYKELRAEGMRVQHAIGAARTYVEFEANDNVRLTWEPDQEIYDDSYIDTWGLSEVKTKQAKQALRERIERDGVWGLVGQYRCTSCGEWTDADSVWSMVGQNGHWYEYDIMDATLRAYEDSK